MRIFKKEWLCNTFYFSTIRPQKVTGPFLAFLAFEGQNFLMELKLKSKWPQNLNLAQIWRVASEMIDPKAESCFKGRQPWIIFSKNFFYQFQQLLEGPLRIFKKNLNKGQKVAHLALIWPFWPWKYKHHPWFIEKVGHSRFQIFWISGGKVMEKIKNCTILPLDNSLCMWS